MEYRSSGAAGFQRFLRGPRWLPVLPLGPRLIVFCFVRGSAITIIIYFVVYAPVSIVPRATENSKFR